MPEVSGADAVARRLSVSQVWRDEGDRGPRDFVPVLSVSAPNLGDGRDGFPGYTQAFDHVVPGNVVRDQPEKRGECIGDSEGASLNFHAKA